MLNPSELSKIVQVAQADYGDTPPNERKRPEDIKAATLRISSLITENPLEIFTIMVENGIPGLHHFEIPHIPRLLFANGLRDTGSFARLLNSTCCLLWSGQMGVRQL